MPSTGPLRVYDRSPSEGAAALMPAGCPMSGRRRPVSLFIPAWPTRRDGRETDQGGSQVSHAASSQPPYLSKFTPCTAMLCSFAFAR